jgi:TonB family protein
MPEMREKFPGMHIFLRVMLAAMRTLKGLMALCAIVAATITLGAQDQSLSPAEAANLVRQAADKGDPRAMSNLGSLFLSGSGVKKDEKEALKWFKKAAEKGDAAGQVSLGTLLLTKDPKTAVGWVRKAADQGSALAQFTLGSIYERGTTGVAGDRAEAMVWYTKALQQGHEEARKPLQALQSLKVITPTEAAGYLLSQTPPRYPPLAQAARVRASVRLEITVAVTGEVRHKVIEGHPLLNQAAIESARSARYRPYLVDGQPTPFITTVTVDF